MQSKIGRCGRHFADMVRVLRQLALLFFVCACGLAAATASAAKVDYTEVRGRVAKAYPQQADEMADAVAVLQQLSEESATLLAKIEAACGK